MAQSYGKPIAATATFTRINRIPTGDGLWLSHRRMFFVHCKQMNHIALTTLNTDWMQLFPPKPKQDI
jgi:hypothetical protein